MKPWQHWIDEGRAAAEAGKGFLDNPYIEEQSDRTRHWVDGYVAGFIAKREAQAHKMEPAQGEGGK